MNIPRSVADILREHVTLEIEGIDRLYLNMYVPILQRPEGTAYFWIHHRGHRLASSALFAPMTAAFVRSIEQFAVSQGVDLIRFQKGRRKDEVAQEYLARFPHQEGIVFIGKAQEKASVPRTEKRRNPKSGQTYPWLVPSTALVNHYYFYCRDRDFGPFFIKFCSYFPYTGKVCLNGHEYLKCQPARRRVSYQALDNGLLSCADAACAQQICDELSAGKIGQLVHKWLAHLPHPFTAEDWAAGYRYDLSMLQAEFSLTQVLDRPQTGRIFFEQVIRDNLDLGRPDRVQLVFNRRLNKKTPGRFRTRIITDGVLPSLYIQYKHAGLKQYHKEGRALRTETTFNNTRGFANRDPRQHVAALPGDHPEAYGAGRMTYDLRRLRLHGLIKRVPNSHRYQVTQLGFRTALFVTRAYNRLFRPGFSALAPPSPPAFIPLRRALESVDQAIEAAWKAQQLAA